VNTGKPNRPNLTWRPLLILSLVAAAGSTGEAKDELQRIGIYDSRAVAYAFFWTDGQQAKRNEQMKAASAAKAAGDTAQFEKLSRAQSDAQEKIHRQVFGSAPVDDALAALEPRLPEIQKRAGAPEIPISRAGGRDRPAGGRVQADGKTVEGDRRNQEAETCAARPDRQDEGLASPNLAEPLRIRRKASFLQGAAKARSRGVRPTVERAASFSTRLPPWISFGDLCWG